jgi:hypothetical protein
MPPVKGAPLGKLKLKKSVNNTPAPPPVRGPSTAARVAALAKKAGPPPKITPEQVGWIGQSMFQLALPSDMEALAKSLRRYGVSLAEVMEEEDWYAAPDEEGRWTQVGSGNFYPIAGSPRAWCVYLRRDGPWIWLISTRQHTVEKGLLVFELQPIS